MNSLALSLLYGPPLTSYMTTGKTIALPIWPFVGIMMSLLFKMLSRFVTAFLPRNKHLLISWLKSWSSVTLETNKRKSVTASTFPHLFIKKWWERMPWSSFFDCWALSQLFHSPLSLSSRGSFASLRFLPWGWCHLHIWSCWYFSQQSGLLPVFPPAWHFTWCALCVN